MKKIKFTSLAKYDKRVTGSGLIDYVDGTYSHMVNCLGEPTLGVDEYKTSAEWHVDVTIDGQSEGVITIYDYKEHTPAKHVPEQTIQWHVGGKKRELADLVINLVRQPCKTL